MSYNSNKDSYEYISEKLMGLEIEDNDKDYGIVIEIRQIDNNFKVYTNLGYSFDAGLIMNLVAISNLSQRKSDDENVTTIPMAYIQNARISNKIITHKRTYQPHTKQMRMTGRVNNIAKVGDEEINITNHISSNEQFPEENQ